MSTTAADEGLRAPASRVATTGWVAIWLVFMGAPLQQVWQRNGTVGRVVGVADILSFAALYLAVFLAARTSWRSGVGRCASLSQRLLMLGGLVALIAIAIPFAGSSSLTMVVYLGAASVFTLSLNVGVLAVFALAAAAELSARLVPGWHGQEWSSAFSILFAGAAVYASRVAFGRSQALTSAREEIAQLAVAEERSRMTRDLHDILGHSLTVITIKAQLANRLVGLDEARAAAEIGDIERLAREALTDVRATISGTREVTLAPELANARGALAAANIDAEVPSAVDDVPSGNRELFGWTVREGVTNVLRHSLASRCEIRLMRTTIEIHDDGVGADPVGTDGSGLRGLRERVAAAGASILTGTSPQLGGFLLQVSTQQATSPSE